MEILKTVLPVCLFLMTTCFAVENTTTVLEQQLKVQKREKQYLIEDDPNEEHEQKRDERQSTPVNSNHNPVDPMANSRIINIRLQPPPKQVLKSSVLKKPINCRVDTPPKIPVILKTGRVVPGPAHALRLKILENKINESISNFNKDNTLSQNTVASPTLNKDNIPYFTIEDKSARRTEGRSGLNNIDDEKSNLERNGTLIRDGKETSGNDSKHSLNKDSNDSINKGKNRINSNTAETVQKPVHFFVDEPEPLPPSLRQQQEIEYTASQSKEVTPNKIKEIPIVKKGNNNPKKDEAKKKDNGNDDEADDPNIVRILNGTHLISIKKIQNHERYKIDRLASQDKEGDTVPTEERIVNQVPPKPKPTADEPQKHSLSVAEKNHNGKEKNVGLAGLVYKDNKNKEAKDQNHCITITKHNYEECEEKAPISPPITLQPPTSLNEGNQESWNYLHNPNYYPYYQNIYDQYRRNYGLRQSTPNVYGQEINDPKNFGVQVNPHIMYSQQNNDPYALNSEITLPYYPNGNPPTDTDSEFSQYPYTYEIQPEIDNTACKILPENNLDRIWRAWKDVELKIRQAQTNDTDTPLDIDIRRNYDEISDGTKGENGIGMVANPYALSSLPVNLNGALIYPYVNPGYRYMR